MPTTNKFLLVFLATIYCTDAINLTNDVRLIGEVHRHFRTTSVLLLHFGRNGLKDFHELRESVRILSMEGIHANSLNAGSWTRVVRSSKSRPLIVVLVKSTNDVSAFSVFTRDFRMAYPIWLLITENDADAKNTTKNIFHLTFDTEMLIFRRNFNKIEEWYSLHNDTRSSHFATWDFDSELALLSNKSLYERRNNLEKTTILVAYVDDSMTLKCQNHTISEFFRKIVIELRNALNFRIKLLMVHERFKPSWWTGTMSMLSSGEVDIATAELTMTSSRMALVDFTHPLIFSYSKLYIRLPEGGIHWSGYLKTFSPTIWIGIGISILVTTLALTIATAINVDKPTNSSFGEHLLLVLGIYCQQGLAEFPTSLSLRITYFCTFVSALIISATYSASLISYLTVNNPELPFTSLEEFLEDGSYKLIVFQNSADYEMFARAKDPTLIKMFSHMKPATELPLTLENAFNQICEERVAFFMQQEWMDSLIGCAGCKLIGVSARHGVHVTIAMSKNNPFHGIINYYMRRFQYDGIADRMKQSRMPRVDNSQEAAFYKVTLSAITPTVIILTAGVILAVLLLFLEWIGTPKNR